MEFIHLKHYVKKKPIDFGNFKKESICWRSAHQKKFF